MTDPFVIAGREFRSRLIVGDGDRIEIVNFVGGG